MYYLDVDEVSLRDLRKAIADVPLDVAAAAGVALRKGALVTAKSLRRTSAFQDQSGRLRRSIRVRRVRTRAPDGTGQWKTVRGGGARVLIGAEVRLRGESKRRRPWYGWILEFGRKPSPGRRGRYVAGRRRPRWRRQKRATSLLRARHWASTAAEMSAPAALEAVAVNFQLSNTPNTR